MNITHAFFERARTQPNSSAIAFSHGTLSYGELAGSARRLWAELAGTPEDSFVGLLAHKSETAYAGVLGILAAGRAYVPLNPNFPVARNRYIVEKADLRTLVVGPECLPALSRMLPELQRRLRIVMLDPSGLDSSFSPEVQLTVARASCDAEPARLRDDAAAYVLFTSGSTGNPKGVVVGHGNVQHYVDNVSECYPLETRDRVSQTFDLTFDLSVHDMFTCWRAGATLVPYPSAALASPIPFTREQRVTVWFSVPSVAAYLESSRMVELGALPGLRLSSFCGEKLTMATVALWRSVAPNSRIVNLYGPTETTVAITHFEVPPDFDERKALHGTVPIGTPFPGQACEVRREDGSLCERGEAGALWLAGAQVSAGYLGEPTLTAERFVPRQERVWYRTGDLALQDADAQLQFLGREDFQVKVMGHRIELGEIEHALVRASGAAQAIAGVATVRNGVDELFAVLPVRHASEKKRIRDELRQSLPAYMVPRHYVFLEDLPLNANGKVDRNALRDIVLAQTQGEM